MSPAGSNRDMGQGLDAPSDAAQGARPFSAFGHTHSVRNWALRLGVGGRRGAFAEILASVLSGAAVLCGIGTYLALTKLDATPSHKSVLVFLNIDLLLLLGLAVLVARRLVRIWAARRAGIRGSKLHVR